MNKALDDAISRAGGISKLVRAIRASSYRQIHNWKTRGVPIHWCERIERATGVPRHQLRPDWFGKAA